jgi:hypothetical protein
LKSEQNEESLDETELKRINDWLAAINKADLYEFLELDKKVETKVLYRKAEKMYKEVGQHSKKTAEVTAKAELCGICSNLFKTEQGRARYDESLRLAVYDEIKEKLDIVSKKENKIHARQLKRILREAKEKNDLDHDETWAIIQEHANLKRILLHIPENLLDEVRELQRCGYCKHLNDANKKFCAKCSKPLQQPCPKCKKPVMSDEMACGNCGFPTGNRAYVEELIHMANMARTERKHATALEYIELTMSAWPVDDGDVLAEEIHGLRDKINKELHGQNGLLSQMEMAIKEKRFYNAQELLADLVMVLPDGETRIIDYQRKITDKLEQVDGLLKQASALSNAKPDDLVMAYKEILSICSDCEKAREVLASTPPQPPTNMRAQVSGKLVHLTWIASASQGVAYTLIRKRFGRPTSPKDGNQVAVIEGTVFDDTTAEVGIPWYYAVYSNRDEVLSKESAILDQPVMILQEVDNLMAQISNCHVHLKWKSPPNVRKVVVRRDQTTFPATILDGIEIQTLDLNQAVDNQVENERCYYYTVYCQFEDLSGKFLTSSGARIRAIPQEPPEPIMKLDIVATVTPDFRKLDITWPPILKGDVVMVKANRSTGLSTGMEIPAQDLSRFGQVLKTNSRNLYDELNHLGMYYYLPVVLFQGMAYIGQEHKFASVDDISELTAHNLGHAIRLQWKWPKNCNEVMISYSHQGWPTPNAPNTTTEMLLRPIYDLKGYYDIIDPIPADYYIIVFAIIGQGEQKIVASGDQNGARRLLSLHSRIILNYEIKKTFLRGMCISLKISGKGSLPAMLLVRKTLTLPMNKHDGEIILKLSPVEITKSKWNVPISNDKKQRHSYAKLFLEDDQLYDVVTIHNPALEKLRLY